MMVPTSHTRWALTATHGFNGHRSEIETDHRNHCASYHGRQQSFDPANAGVHDNHCNGAVQHACRNYAAKIDIPVWVSTMPGIAASMTPATREKLGPK